MIANYSNTKTGGQIGLKICEGGTPIMGRTSLNGGVYLPVQVDNSGKLLTGSGSFFSGQSSALNTSLANPFTYTQAEILAIDTLFNAVQNINIEFTPYFIIPSNTQNGIFDLIIYLDGSDISNYINTLVLGISSFDPAQTDLDGIIEIQNICHGNVNGYNINATSTGISGSAFVSTNLEAIKLSLLTNQSVKFALVAHRNHNPDLWGGVLSEIKFNIKNVSVL
jgi:hypothetical protein